MRPVVSAPCPCLVSYRRRQRILVCLLGVLFLRAPFHVHAGEWKFGASIGANLTATDNVFLAPAGQEQRDLVLGVVPSFSASLDAARLKVNVNLSPTLYTYMQNQQADYIAGAGSAVASLEAAEKFFYIDGFVQNYQTFISPFATQPESGASITNNRTQTTVLNLSPYIKSTTSSGVSYLFRDDNTWSTSDTAGLSNVYVNNLTATVDGPTDRWVRWGVDYNYNYTRFQNNEAPFRLQLGRLRGTHFVDPQLSLTADVGYEKNDYTLSGYHGPIYGAGFDWKPTERADIYANAEHRFFGTSYSVGFNNRTRLTAFSLSASRGIQTYPQQLTVPAGSTAFVLDKIFQATIPDPVARQQAVNDFIQKTGLPPTLGAPFNYYTNQIYVVEQVGASFGLIGARNSLTFSLFWYNSTPVTASGQALPIAFASSNAITQSGGGVAFSHQLSAYTSLTANVNRVSNRTAGSTFNTIGAVGSVQTTYWVGVAQQLSPKTSGTLGVRYVNFDSDLFSSYTELAVVAGIVHTF